MPHLNPHEWEVVAVTWIREDMHYLVVVAKHTLTGVVNLNDTRRFRTPVEYRIGQIIKLPKLK